MPRVTIWIRNEDFGKWESLRDKPTFIHNALNMREAYQELAPIEKKLVKQHLKAAPAAVYCKHGQVKGNCLAKDNKECNK